MQLSSLLPRSALSSALCVGSDAHEALPLGRPSAPSRALQDALHHLCMQPWLWAKPLLGSVCPWDGGSNGHTGGLQEDRCPQRESGALSYITSLSSFFPIFSLYFSLCFVLRFSLHFSFSVFPYIFPYTFSYPFPYSISYTFPYAFPYPFPYNFLNEEASVGKHCAVQCCKI